MVQSYISKTRINHALTVVDFETVRTLDRLLCEKFVNALNTAKTTRIKPSSEKSTRIIELMPFSQINFTDSAFGVEFELLGVDYTTTINGGRPPSEFEKWSYFYNERFQCSVRALDMWIGPLSFTFDGTKFFSGLGSPYVQMHLSNGEKLGWNSEAEFLQDSSGHSFMKRVIEYMRSVWK